MNQPMNEGRRHRDGSLSNYQMTGKTNYEHHLVIDEDDEDDGGDAEILDDIDEDDTFYINEVRGNQTNCFYQMSYSLIATISRGS